jgi:hypothetical protein
MKRQRNRRRPGRGGKESGGGQEDEERKQAEVKRKINRWRPKLKGRAGSRN